MTQVVSSISGLEIYSPSAGFAPTNSGDVSAIASGYQVVSSTATQLYAGTAFLTGVNGAPVSASRAGQAANASMANSAYYDGTGRLISSLPDSAAVSSIASSYAESAASSKLDTSAQVVTATAGDGTYVTSINGMGISGEGGGVTGDYVDKSATEAVIGSSNTATDIAFAQGVGNSASGSSLAQGYGNTADNQSLAQGYWNTAKFGSMAQGFRCTATYTGFAQGVSNSAYYYSVAQGNTNSAAQYSFVQGRHNTANVYSFAQGDYNSAKNTAVVFGTYNLSGDGSTATGNSAAFAIGDGTAYNARHDLMLVTKDGEITMYSSTADTVGTGIMSSIRAISAAATGGGASLPITGTSGDDSANYDASSIMFTRYDTAGEPDIRTAMLTPDSLWMDYTLDGDEHTSMTLNESMLNFTLPDGDRYVDAYTIDTWNSAVDTVANNSASWGGGATGDYVEKSALESALILTSQTAIPKESATAITSISGITVVPKFLQPNTVQNTTANGSTFYYMPSGSPWSTATVATGVYSPLQYATGACLAMNAEIFKAYYKGNEWFVSNTEAGMLRGEIHATRGIRIVGSAKNSASGFMLHPSGVNGVSSTKTSTKTWGLKPEGVSGVGGNGTAWQYGTAENIMLTSVYDTVSSNSASWSGGSLPITGSAGDDTVTYGANSLEFTRYDTAGEPDIRTAELSPDHFYIDYTLDGDEHTSMTLNESMLTFTIPGGDRWVDAYSIDTWNSAVDTVANNSASWGQGGVDSATVSSIASSYAESAVSSKLDSSASSSFYTTANESGFVDSATVSAIASSYAESAVSSKMDSSAIDYTRTGGGTQIYASGTGSSTNQFSAKNDSAGAAIIAGENARLRLWDTAATANLYASSIGGWNAAANLVSSQSANWGGSALALSAGPGVSLTKSGDTLTVSTETVLWSGTPVTVSNATTGLPLAESPYNFDRVALYWVPWNYTANSLEKQEAVTEARITSAIPRIGSVTEWNAEGSNNMFIFVLNAYFDASKFYTQAIKYFSIGDWTVNIQGTGSYITKIVGINRTAEA